VFGSLPCAGGTSLFQGRCATIARPLIGISRLRTMGLTVLVFSGHLYCYCRCLSFRGLASPTITGVFFFGTQCSGFWFNVTGATLGLVVIFLRAAWGWGRHLKGANDASGRACVRKIKAGYSTDKNQWSMLFFFEAGSLLLAVLRGEILFLAFLGVPIPSLLLISTFWVLSQAR